MFNKRINYFLNLDLFEIKYHYKQEDPDSKLRLKS